MASSKTSSSAKKGSSKVSSVGSSAKGPPLTALKNLIFGSSKKSALKKSESKSSPANKQGTNRQRTLDKKAQLKETRALLKTVVTKVATSSQSESIQVAKTSGNKSINQSENKVAKKPKAKREGFTQTTSGGMASPGESVCREVACEGLATTGGYCRLHYIKNWKKIKRKELILREKKLNQYIEELVAKYPDKYIEAIRQDLASDKDFAKVIHDLDLDQSIDEFEMESESVDTLIDNIKRDFDDEGESF